MSRRGAISGIWSRRRGVPAPLARWPRQSMFFWANASPRPDRPIERGSRAAEALVWPRRSLQQNLPKGPADAGEKIRRTAGGSGQVSPQAPLRWGGIVRPRISDRVFLERTPKTAAQG